MKSLIYTPPTPVVAKILVFSGEQEKVEHVQEYWHLEPMAARHGFQVIYLAPDTGNWTGQMPLAIMWRQIMAVNQVAFPNSTPDVPWFELGYSDGAVEVQKRLIWWLKKALENGTKIPAGMFAYAGHLRYRRAPIPQNKVGIMLARNSDDRTLTTVALQDMEERWLTVTEDVQVLRGTGGHLARVDQTLLPVIETWFENHLPAVQGS